MTDDSDDSTGVARSQRLGVVKLRGPGDGSPSAESRGGTPVGVWRQSQEAKKQDVHFELRFTLVNAYCPFYASYIITM